MEALIAEFDLEGYRRMLEVGGNTGAFSLALLRRFPELKATVLDLPVVCRLGEDYVRGRPGAERLRFFAGDARRDPWPLVAGRAADLIVFKSVLHDWPETETGVMSDKDKGDLTPGGRVIICERGPLEDEIYAVDRDAEIPFSMASNLVFSPFYRPAAFYVEALRKRGFGNLNVRQAKVEMTFNVVSATFGEAGG